MTQVAILMGSDSDWPVMSKAADELKRLGVATRVEVTSAHRTPARTIAIVKEAEADGALAFIVGAGGAAHLAGTVAAHTTRPVIGVPVNSTSLQGLDSLLATVQMPAGIPVATVAVDGAHNAALLAAQILAVADEALAGRLREHRVDMERKVIAKNEALKKQLAG